VITLIARHKWGEDVYVAKDDEEFYEKALELLKERFNAGYWYDNWGPGERQWEEEAAKIVAEGDGKKAWAFLEERRDFEYEWVEEGVAR